MTFATRLLEILSGLEQTFLPDELAYLAVTSKVEGPIRDRIAYQLHQEITPGLYVHREWQVPGTSSWVDIAVTDGKKNPRQLLELKAHSGATYEKNYTRKCAIDLHKMKNAAVDDTECYLLFLFNHLYHKEKLDPKFRWVIKYFDLQNTSANRNKFAENVSDNTELHWLQHLKELGFPREKTYPGVRMKGGNFHSMPLCVHSYLLGPLYRTDLEHLPLIE